MKKRFTILAAAFALLAFLAIPVGAWATDVTFSYSDYSGHGTQSSGSEYTMVKTDVEITNTKFYGNTNYAHFYANGTTTITPKNGATITRIVLTATSTSYNGYQSGGAITVSTGSVNADGTTVTWTGSSSDAFTLANNKQIRWTSIVVTYSSNSNVVDAPSFTPNGGIFLDSQEVSISCTTSDATIQYSTNNGSTWTNYTTPFTLTATTTVQAKAIKSGMTDSEVTTATFTKTTPLTTMQAIFDKATEVGGTATEVYITLNNWIVSGVSTNEKNVFVTDGTKGFVIYDGGGNMGFNTGDILSGTVSCKVQLYHGFAELTLLNATTSGISVATGGSVTAANIAMADLAGVNTGALVHYDNLTCSIDNNNYYLSDGITTIQVFNSIYAFGSALVADHVYNITGVYQQYTTNNADTKEVLPRNANDIEEVTTNIPTITAEDVNITYDATSGAIVYTIENEVTGGVLTAATESEWLTLGAVGATVPFTCTANDATTARTATVTLTYTYSRATVTKDVIVTQAAYEAPHYTWDLSIDQTATATTTEMTWTSNYATMAVEKVNATTNTNNYYPGTPDHNYTSTRFYKNSELTISPAAGYAIISVVFQATSHNYATALQGSAWTNATAVMEDGDNVTVVTITPTDGTIDMTAVIGGTCGFTGVTVYYEENNNPSITANNVEIAYGATNGSITYTINNQVTGGVLTAATTDEWLTLGTVGATVPFTCAANTAASPRTATVTLTYTYNTDQIVTKNVTVTQAGNPSTIDNISDITAAGTYTVQGTIVAISNRGFILGDGTGYVYYYYGAEFEYGDYDIGDMVKLSGSVVVHGGVFEFDNNTSITYVDESNYVEENPTVLSGADMDARVASTDAQLSSYVQYEGTFTISGTHYNVTNISGATTAIGSISYPLNSDEITALNNKQVKVTGYYVGISSSTYYNTMIGSIEEVEVQHEEYTLTVSNLVNVNTYVFDAADESEMLLEGEGSVQILDGTMVMISVDVEEGYAIESLMVDGVDVTSQIDETGAYTFTMPTHNVTITATAVEIIAPTDDDYVRITSLNQLTDGSIVVIAARYDGEHTNGYYAMPNATSGKPEGVAFTSVMSDNDEILPAAIADENEAYYWVVNVTDNGYTFTNANGQMIGYTSGTNFATGGNNTEWTIELSTSESGLVPDYSGFIITNKNNTSRAFAFNGTAFGAYSLSNINAGYNFFLDFFVQTAGSETVTQTIELTAGWNLISTYLAVEDPVEMLDMLKVSLGENATEIQSEDNITEYDGEWFGDLDDIGLENEKGYFVNVINDCTVELTGTPANAGDYLIYIHNGWNYIGFPSAVAIEVNTALADFEAADGDQIQTDYGMTEYDGEWFGDMEMFEPGYGIMYYSTSDEDKPLVFQTGAKARRNTKSGKLIKK